MGVNVGIVHSNNFCSGRAPTRWDRISRPPRRRTRAGRQMMRIAIYLRVSTLRQAQAQSIDQQLDRLREHVARRGWDLPEQNVFRDDGQERGHPQPAGARSLAR
jgi:hypothetical protein